MHFPIELPAHYMQLATELSVRPEDVDEHFIRGGGHGGQKINKTASCVQLSHRPTRIEVRCQAYREQSRNRLAAWKQLLLKIEERVRGWQSQKTQEIFKMRKQKARRSRRDRKSTRLNSSHIQKSRMPSSA